jgi:hypothetical protein
MQPRAKAFGGVIWPRQRLALAPPDLCDAPSRGAVEFLRLPLPLIPKIRAPPLPLREWYGNAHSSMSPGVPAAASLRA